MHIRFFIFFILTSTIFFTNCGKDKDENTLEPISGVWHLKNVSGGITGININYNRGLVKWTFNNKNHKLSVENNILTTGPEDIYAGLDTGVYSYEIRKDGQIETLYIENNKRGVVIIANDSLKLDDNVAADGLIKEFKR
ncbi:hypothetical protein [uncultured Maribacter sp.]|uniref:hypothetical protein n=1 Tax=uncultured Maribacter sp. TaxID=431308 RepID=UPI00260A4E70|nr:hypothetical protein [uncultured Maribacter sp.]